MNRSLRTIAILAAIFVFTSASILHAQPDARIRHGLQLIELGDPAAAVAELAGVVRDNPKSADAHGAYAMALVANNDVTTAATEAQAAFDIDRKSVLARTARGVVYGKQGRVQDALSEFHQALKINDKDIGTYLALSRYYLTLDSNKQAEVTLLQAVNVNEKDVRSHIGLAELYEKEHINQLAINQYEAAKEADPNDVSVLAHLAGLYHRSRQYDNSINEWIKITRIDSNYAPAYYEIGNLYFLAGHYAEASYYAEKYLEHHGPDPVKGNWLLARALTKNNQFTQALPALQAVSSNDSLKALSQLLLAQSYFYSKDFPKAIAAYQAGKMLSAEDYEFWGRSLLLTGDTVGAIEKLKLSVEQNDTTLTPAQRMEAINLYGATLQGAHHNLEAADLYAKTAETQKLPAYLIYAAQMYNLAGRRDTARDFYERALQQHADSLKVLEGLGIVLLQSQPTAPRMKEVFTTIVELAKSRNATEDLGIGYWGLGQAAYYAKDYHAAVEQFELALKTFDAKSPYLCNTYLTMAVSYHSEKKYSQAVEYYKKSLACDPTNETVKKNLTSLEEFLKKEK